MGTSACIDAVYQRVVPSCAIVGRVTPREEKIREVLKGRQSGLIVVLEDIHDPHNAAAILRTCDALGVHQAQLTNGCHSVRSKAHVNA